MAFVGGPLAEIILVGMEVTVTTVAIVQSIVKITQVHQHCRNDDLPQG